MLNFMLRKSSMTKASNIKVVRSQDQVMISNQMFENLKFVRF